MKTSDLSFVPLSQASLCLDCEVITAAPTSCPACGSGALMNMARALSRPYGGAADVCHTTVNDAYAKHIERQAFLASQDNSRVQDFRLLLFKEGEA